MFMKTHKYFFMLFLFALQTLVHGEWTPGLNKNQIFGGFGADVYGFDPQADRFISFYWVYGLEWNHSKDIKFGLSTNAVKFNWTQFSNDSSKNKNQLFDDIKYFSISTDLQVFTRIILDRERLRNKNYKMFMEFGIGYNAPFYYDLKKIKDNNELTEKYPNRYNDIYLYSGLFMNALMNIPIVAKIEYHPFDVIKNSSYPDLPVFRISFDIFLHDGDQVNMYD